MLWSKRRRRVKRKKNSIFMKILYPLIVVVFFQAMIFCIAIFATGTLNLLDDNAIRILEQNIQSQKISLENQMIQKWSNLSGSTGSFIRKAKALVEEEKVDITYLHTDKNLQVKYLEAISQDLVQLIRNNSVTGAFLILSDGKKEYPGNFEKLKGVYIRDLDITMNMDNNSDLLLEKGPAIVSSNLNIAMDTLWSSDFWAIQKGEENTMEYYYKPLLAAYHYPELEVKELGYWEPPFYLHEETDLDSYEVMSYSIPLLSEEGIPFGVLGIEVSMDYIESSLKAKEIDEYGRGGYALVNYDKAKEKNLEECTILKIIGTSLYTFMDKKDTITLKRTKNYYNLYEMKELALFEKKVYCKLIPLKIYNNNGVYSERQWALMGIANEEALFGIRESLQNNIFIAFMISFFTGVICVYFVSKYTTKPLRGLTEQLKQSNWNQKIKFDKIKVQEVDELAQIIQGLSEEQEKNRANLIQERERYLVALESATEIMVEYDTEEDIFMVYQLTQEEQRFEKRMYKNFTSIIEAGEICFEQDKEKLYQLIKGNVKGVTQLRIKANTEGVYYWFAVKVKPVYDENQKLLRVIGSTRNITEEKEKEFARNEEIKRDKVTKLLKKEEGEKLIEHYCLTNIEVKGCYCIIDLDHFMQLNNIYGVLYCDIILEQVGMLIQQNITSQDIAYRLGGDEIVVLLLNKTKEEAEEICFFLKEEIKKIYIGEEKSFILSASIGVYYYKTNKECEHARGFAESALVCAKEQGGDCIVVFDDKNKIENKPWKSDNIVSFYFEEENLTSIVFNLFEKMNDITSTITVLLGKIGRTYQIEHILVMEQEYDFTKNHILSHWGYTKEQLEERRQEFHLKEWNTFFSKLEKENIIHKKEEEIESIYCAMYDNGTYMGMVLFERAKKELMWSEKEEDVLKEIVRIMAAHISKSKSDLASKAKSEFLARMSHEIRTPMNAIIGMTTIAQTIEEIPEQVTDCLHKIESSTKYLLSLINDVLDMSRIESGRMKIEKENFCLEEVIKEIDILIRSQAERKNINFVVNTQVQNLWLIGDTLRISQILMNLLGNAVKFTEENGEIILTVKQMSDNKDLVEIYFSVKDNGIGISDKNRTRIFDAFEQAEDDTTRKFGGTGLGLAISSNLVRMMGGKLELESELGKGAEFYFTILFPTGFVEVVDSKSNKTEKIQEEYQFEGKKVLLVEDNDLNVEIAQTILEMVGFFVTIAKDGKQAVDIYLASELGAFDAILMDIRMPIMGGLEATKLIRSSKREDAKTIPIIALSANAFEEDIEKSMKSGMNGHLAKPIDVKQLYNVLDEVIKQ